jgi:biotin transport system substrate-specific component
MNQTSIACYDYLIRPNQRWMEVPILIGFNLVLVVSAYLSINLPFSPVPITGQTLGVLLIGMALGRVRGTAVVLAYLLEGFAGLPVFAGGKSGMVALMGPTGGYLLGFLGAAFVVGYFSDRGWYTGYIKSVAAMIAGTGVIFIAGLAWLAAMVPEGSVLAMGLYPFLPGAALKIAAASVVLPSICRFVGRD